MLLCPAARSTATHLRTEGANKRTNGQIISHLINEKLKLIVSIRRSVVRTLIHYFGFNTSN